MHLTHILAGQRTRGLAAVGFEYFERSEPVLAMTTRVEMLTVLVFELRWMSIQRLKFMI